MALLLISCVGAAAVLSYSIVSQPDQLAGAAPVEHLFIWASAGSFSSADGVRGGFARRRDAGPGDHHRSAGDGLFPWLHGPRQGLCPLLHLPGPVQQLDARADHQPEPARDLCVLGAGGHVFLSAWSGFWYDRDGAAHAAQKAFVVNRVGDFGLLLGILGLFWATGSFDFQGIADGLQTGTGQLARVAPWAALLLCLLVFMGPMAKSAQFPLHVWLPDAMEGPTPISALIHAATMVAAGRLPCGPTGTPLHPVPELSKLVVAVVGTITCFLGASIALTQMDLKKGLAYSTVSQLGYMMLAMGCGAPVAGMFHLVTHAFFKAMLFLGSGSVIHAMEDVVGSRTDPGAGHATDGRTAPQDARSRRSPSLIGCIAISGIPPLAGFWSKDEILGQAFNSYPVLWLVGFLTAGMTAFYMFRLYFLTFEGEFRGERSPPVAG